jgi:hypothetical protein
MDEQVQAAIKEIRRSRLIQLFNENVGDYVRNACDEEHVCHDALKKLEKEFYPGRSDREIMGLIMSHGHE